MSALPRHPDVATVDREAPAVSGGELVDRMRSETYWTSLRYFSISRLAVAGLIVALVPLFEGRLRQLADLQALQAGALLYVAVAIALLLLIEPLRPRYHLQFTMQVVIDIVMVGSLMHVAGGVVSGLGLLFVAPIAGAAILGSRRRALLFAAIATMTLLIDTGWRLLRDDDFDTSIFIQAGLTGALVFAGAWLVSGLAARLERQATLASERGIGLRNQFAVNQLVISELADGVVVLDAGGALLTMNRAAQQLLGLPLEAGATPIDSHLLVRSPAWRVVETLWREWRVDPSAGPESDVEASLPGFDGRRGHRVRIRLLSPGATVSGDTVIVLEDLDRVEERAEQLKLASMGRLSASIAHEVRNPLAAIRHANALLREQLADARMQRLAQIVEDNSVRINRTVEDVLSIARRERPVQEDFAPAALIAETISEVLALSGHPPGRVVFVERSPACIHFDPNQLRQVLVNLLTNALRHATHQPGAVRVEWREGVDNGLELAILDDGLGVPAQTQQHVFEPFFTTEARGTGLGLFLARELCLLNGASLRYEPVTGDERFHGAFVIAPARARAPA